jgi:hypothetical protein
MYSINPEQLAYLFISKTLDAGYQVSQRIRKRIEEIFG